MKRVADANRETEQHEVLSLLHRWKAAQFPDTTERLAASPIANFSERDLLGYFQECDFSDIHLELHIDVRRAPGLPWNTFLRSSPHPWAPTHGVIFEQRFTHDEREVLEQTLRPTVETGSSAMIYRIAYLSAVKPLAEARTPTRTVAPND